MAVTAVLEEVEPGAVPAEAHRRVESLRRELERSAKEELAALASRSVAVASGKGGVGKTITAVNLALYYALGGSRVGLIDLDPLSDVASLLDIQEAEAALSAQRLDEGPRTLEEFTCKLFGGLDLIFPSPKLGRGESLRLLELIFRRYRSELLRGYDLLIFDLPAGSGYEENLSFLSFIGKLVLVTNPQPTAHAAAGTYLRRLFALYPGRLVYLWHNRYAAQALFGFNPSDVIGNYNRNVPRRERLSAGETKRVTDLAFVPEDSALDLLRGEPSVREHIRRCLLDTLQFLLEQRVAALAAPTAVSSSLLPLVVGFLCRQRHLQDPGQALQRLGEHLQNLAGIPGEPEPFTPAEREAYLVLLRSVGEDRLRRALTRVIGLLEDSLRHAGQPRGLAGGSDERSLDRELSRLLLALGRLARGDRSLANGGGLLLFYFALYKLFRSDTVVQLIDGLVPRRRGPRGRAVRDRNRQIRYLVEKDPDYRQRYLRLVRMLQPVVLRQTATVVKAFGLGDLLFRDASGRLLRAAYLKLLTNLLHDTLYSGLSVIVGFPYRNAAVAFQEGAERLREQLAAR
jgi:MinD-like ATPase involved in chromosome partitioning or flagellar assembly